LATVPAKSYKFGLSIKHQQYYNHQLRLWADGTRILQKRQAFCKVVGEEHQQRQKKPYKIIKNHSNQRSINSQPFTQRTLQDTLL
jgi:hypothetical protein